MFFNSPADYPGSVLFLGAVFFAFQIYGDFSGYSDIAIGTARLFGFSLMQNFAFPYFSRDIAEFWRRWHISLSTWFRDYLYIPLGGSKGGLWMKIRNTFIIFLVSGFWHGANWTFVVWGGLNAAYFLPLLLTKNNRKNLDVVAHGKIFPTLKETIGMLGTFLLTVFAWIFFRSDTVTQALLILGEIFSPSIILRPEVLPLRSSILVFMFVLTEWFGRNSLYAIEPMAKSPPIVRWTGYGVILGFIYFFGKFSEEIEFIY